jgi:hypothetical protein
MHYGLLYQVFSSLGRALTISVQKNRREAQSIVLVVEPPGGDLVETGPKQCDVYQYKARSSGQSWSLNDIIDKVLPDLYRVVPLIGTIPTHYWLVSEGGAGEWEEARALFQKVASIAPEQLPRALDDDVKRTFLPGRGQTEREFFLDIARRVTKRQGEIDRDTLSRVQNLLINFDLKTVDFAAVQEKVTTLLLGFVEHSENLPHMVDSLVGLMVRWGAEGDRSFTVSELLRSAGLAPTSLLFLPFARERIRERLDSQLAKTMYDRTKHVHRPVVWPEGRSVLCIAGESGMGKTSLLGQVADAAVERGPVVFWRPRRDETNALHGAADEVWNQILEHDATLSLDAIARRADALKLSGTGSWLTICLDVTADPAYAAELIDEDWDKWRIRMAFTADASAARHVAASKRSNAVVVMVSEFTPRQIREFFTQRQIDWRRIPPFVIEPLRRHPILAYVYAELGDVETWRDTIEYALFRRFWRRLTDAPGQHEHPNDAAALTRLADTLLETPDVTYWSATQLDELRIDSAMRVRLQRLGWIRNDADGRAEFMHQRIMNWAVAEAAVERFHAGRWSSHELGKRLEKMLSWSGDKHRRSGFVPMDALSIALSSEIQVDDMATLLEAMENPNFYENLYENLVPTLGTAVVPALLERLRRVGSRRRAPNSSVRASILSIAANEPLHPTAIVTMLTDPHTSVQRTGVELLKEHPAGAALDALWHLRNQLRNTKPDDALINHLDLDAVGDALESCVRVDPQWLFRTLRETTDPEKVARLVRLLATLANDTGMQMWQASKSLILALVNDDGIAAGAARCIGRYRDSEEIPRLVSWIADRSPDVVEESFSALTMIEPSKALELLQDSVRVADVSHIWSTWWSRLFAYDQSGMDETIKQALRGSDLLRRIRLDDMTCSRLAPEFVERLDYLIQTEGADDAEALHNEIDHLMRWLARAHTPDALRFLRDLAGIEVGRQLAAYAAKRSANSNIEPDSFLEDADTVLLRIGGEPLQVFLTAQIARRDHGWLPHKIRAFQSAPSPDARRVVESILEEVWDAQRGEDDDWPVRSACIETLASMGDRGVVMRAEESGRLSYPSEFPRAIRDLPPADERETTRLLQKAASDENGVSALRALAWSRRTDVVGYLVEQVVSTRPEEVRNAARTALDYLPTGHMSPSHREQLRAAGEHSTYLDALFRDGQPESIDEAANYLVTSGPKSWTFDDAHSAASLVVYRGRVDLAPTVWQWAKDYTRFYWEGNATIWRALGYVESEDAEEFLFAETYSGKRGNINPVAIDALARRQRDEAFAAAVHLFDEGKSSRASAPDLLIEIDKDRAVQVIAERLPRERNVLIRTSSCIALRGAADDDIRRMTHDWMGDADPFIRAGGCELLGWLRPHDTSRLRDIALTDLDPMVQVFALDAFARHESQRVTADLLAELSSAEGTAAWAFTDALIKSTHPLLLDRFDDPLALHPALKGKPGALRVSAATRLKKRVEEVKKKYDQPMRRDFYRH